MVFRDNVIVVCKKYYLDVVLNELSTTYVQEDRGSQCVILDHLQYMTKVNINVEPEHEDLPSFYWLPKLHKNPYWKRFIAASNRCTVLALIIRTVKNNCYYGRSALIRT